MFTFDQSLAGQYHTAELRAQAQRDGLARQAAPRRLRDLARRLGR